MKTKTVAGIEYELPTATLLHATPLINAELAGRTCYDSFDKSEHESVREFNGSQIDDVEHSDLLNSLCHVYHHTSVIEHINLTFNITTSRGVLQEQARHRVQSLSVQSTRYTMSPIINAFVASISNGKAIDTLFYKSISKVNFLVTNDEDYNHIEYESVFKKLNLQLKRLGLVEFLNISLGKDQIEWFNETEDRTTLRLISNRFSMLNSLKHKKNVGDNFKHIVTDNWKVNMVVTFNLRSLKNYFMLRDSGAAFWQIRELAQAMKEATPKKYLDLIVKEK